MQIIEEFIPGENEADTEGFRVLHPMSKEDIRTSQTRHLIHIANSLAKYVAREPQSTPTSRRVQLSAARGETQRRIGEELARRPRIDLIDRMMIYQAFLRACMQGTMHPSAKKDQNDTPVRVADNNVDIMSAFLANKYPVTIQDAINQASHLLMSNSMGNLMAGALSSDSDHSSCQTYHFEQVPVEWYYLVGQVTFKKIDSMWILHPINTSVLETQSSAVLRFLSTWFEATVDETAEKWGFATLTVPSREPDGEESFENARNQTRAAIQKILKLRPVFNMWDFDRLHEAAILSAVLPSELLRMMKANRVPAALLDIIPDYDPHLPRNRLHLAGTGNCKFFQRLEIWRAP
jgi:hypothetical protein